ncbi:MAG: tripartite tricarboxylate transporter substrate binding protein, partial [Proteobacteria bacterium]|nr:tripartite tricarboxylate transporter substrate binding protein [Pseudomonadota bacterium]
MRSLLRVVLMLVAVGAGDLAHAQAWPTKPIKLVVGFAPGAQPDIIGRLLADRLTRVLGQQVIVENRPGAANLIGAQAVARAPADGYTYFFGTSAALITNPLLFKTLPYDPLRDFIPVSFVGKSPFFVLAHPDLPVKNMAELFALAKAKPGTLNFATDGARNASGVLASWVSKTAGASIQQVPYAVMPQGVQDTLAGRTQLVVLSVAPSTPHIRSGALRPLAVSTATRLPGWDAVPAIAETVPGFEFVGWFGIVAPTGSPAEAVQRFSKELSIILRDPEMLQRLQQFGNYPQESAQSPEGFAELMRSERILWAKLLK